MAARRRSFVQTRPGQRRKMLWGSALSTAPSVLAENSRILAFSFTEAQLDQEIPATLIRVRGQVMIRSDVDSLDETQLGILGIAVVTEQARVGGIASLPDPGTDSDSSIWQTWLPMITGSNQGTTIHNGPGVFEVDVKSQRKISSGQSIVGIMANNSAAHALEFSLLLRFLFKLH